MEVMAEANEQPALLNEGADERKKTRRPRNAAARKSSAAKSGERKTRRPAKEQAPDSAVTNNDAGSEVAQEEPVETNSQSSLPLSDEQGFEIKDSPDKGGKNDSGATMEPDVPSTIALQNSHEVTTVTA